MASVAMLSMKHAASRPRPPLPSAASGSHLRRSALLFGRQPAVHDAVAQRQRRRLVPVPPCRHAGVLADRKPELGEDRTLDLDQRQFIDRLARRRIICRVISWDLFLQHVDSCD
jgi:hypothetical protein